MPTYKKGEKGKYSTGSEEAKLGKPEARKLKGITKKTLPYSFEERLPKTQRGMDGLGKQLSTGQYSGQAQTTRRVAEEDSRYCIWHDLKKPERKRKNLIRLGVDRKIMPTHE
ncbi:hypothetical protein V8V91_19435 [Algoriphagus halophilus]|uniref:hypothetical protein n=1 Tax=Algoriphagus halophilus TaxID=226505 RepID=UPI00358FEFBA